MTEFALATLLTVALLVELAKHCLRVNTKGNFLHLNRLEQLQRLLLRLLSSPLLCFTPFLLGRFSFLIGGFAVSGLGL